jgi:hypothetical protein
MPSLPDLDFRCPERKSEVVFNQASSAGRRSKRHAARGSAGLASSRRTSLRPVKAPPKDGGGNEQ